MRIHVRCLEGLLYEQQHGFRAKRSCETQLLSTINDNIIAVNLDEGKQTDVIQY